jgi:hypothetical protein
MQQQHAVETAIFLSRLVKTRIVFIFRVIATTRAVVASKCRKPLEKMLVATAAMRLAIVSNTHAKAWAFVTLIVELARVYREIPRANTSDIVPAFTLLAIQSSVFGPVFELIAAIVGLIEQRMQGAGQGLTT